jgi:hypothetical protein
MDKKITKIRRGILQQAFMKAVLDKGNNGIHYDDVIKIVEKIVDFTDRELSLNPSGVVRWKAFLPFGMIPLVKFGWLKREKNIFWMTDKGKQALAMEPGVMRDELKALWEEWKTTNSNGTEEADDSNEAKPSSTPAAEPEFFLETPMYLNNERTVFKRVDYDLAGLLHYIDIGDIGLPDIQRPFVWTSAKVRDLFDSMYRGFPVGYLLFWSNAGAEGSRFIGTNEKTRTVPHLLIVDGQQRLTSLYAVFRGIKVLDQDYKEKQIEIAFRPRDGKFEVSDAATKRDPEFIPNISELWSSNKSSWSLVNDFLKRLGEKRILTDKQKEMISHNLDRLFDLQKYPFTALEISPSVDEEQVADIFVRINSEGVKLNQGDFILTLLSVFWDEGRKELERFCHDSRIPTTGTVPSSFNHFIKPDPGQLLRVEVATGFYRGRLKIVYQLLRGKDFETGQFSPDVRDEQFSILKQAQQVVLNLSNWHGYFNCLIGAGFRSQDLISSETCLIYCYAFYLIGKTKFKIPQEKLQSLISRYFFTASISNRYAGSFESTIEADLNKIKDLTAADGFSAALEKIIADTLTTDFWNIALPNALDSSSAQNPAYYAYLAAQNKLGAPVLFSKNRTISDMLDPTVRANRKTLEKHHLFPRAWLEEEGVTDLKLINQVANFALIDWSANAEISDTAPEEYVEEMKKCFDAQQWSRMCQFHALPDGWKTMRYEDFLVQRRSLMAQIIKQGYESIK